MCASIGTCLLWHCPIQYLNSIIIIHILHHYQTENHHKLQLSLCWFNSRTIFKIIDGHIISNILKFRSTWKLHEKGTHTIEKRLHCCQMYNQNCVVKCFWCRYAAVMYFFMMDRLCEQWECFNITNFFFFIFSLIFLNVFFLIPVFIMLFRPRITVYFFFSLHESYRRRFVSLSLSLSCPYGCIESLSYSNARKTIGTSIVRSVNHWIVYFFMYSMRVFVILTINVVCGTVLQRRNAKRAFEIYRLIRMSWNGFRLVFPSALHAYFTNRKS